MTTFKLLGILLTGFVDSLGIGLVYPIFAALLFDPQSPLVEPGASAAYRGALLGILISLTPLVQFFSSPLMGAFSDIKGRRLTLALGIGLGLVGYGFALTGIWISSLSFLFLYRTLLGFSDGTVTVAQAALADLSTEENKARHFSLFNACQGFGFTIGPFLGGMLSFYGFDMPFLAAGTICLLNLLLILWKFPETRTINPERSFNLLEGFSNIFNRDHWKAMGWFFAAGFIMAFGWSFFSEFAPVFLRDRLDFSASEMGYFYACSGGWYAISAGIGTAPLLKRFSPEALVRISFCACGSALILFSLVQEPFHLWLVLPVIMYMLALIYPVVGAIISNRTSIDKQGEVLGIYHSVWALATGLSPLFVGSAIGVFPPLAGFGSAAAMFLGGWTFWLGCRKSPQTSAIAAKS